MGLTGLRLLGGHLRDLAELGLWQGLLREATDLKLLGLSGEHTELRLRGLPWEGIELRLRGDLVGLRLAGFPRECTEFGFCGGAGGVAELRLRGLLCKCTWLGL